MREAITAHEIANTLRMMRTQFEGSFMIVEGDTDARLYQRFIEKDNCRIVPALGKKEQ